ncbi:hypothetical protein GCM10009672_05220 [Nesterenkonia lutea]
MRWKRRAAWGPAPLAADEWAVLRAQIVAGDLISVDDAVEELTGFMDPFREDLEGLPVVGVTDGQLSVAKHEVLDDRGRRALALTFYAADGSGSANSDAFTRLNSAASALVDYFNAEGITVESITWTEGDPVKRPF